MKKSKIILALVAPLILCAASCDNKNIDGPKPDVVDPSTDYPPLPEGMISHEMGAGMIVFDQYMNFLMPEKCSTSESKLKMNMLYGKDGTTPERMYITNFEQENLLTVEDLANYEFTLNVDVADFDKDFALGDYYSLGTFPFDAADFTKNDKKYYPKHIIDPNIVCAGKIVLQVKQEIELDLHELTNPNLSLNKCTIRFQVHAKDLSTQEIKPVGGLSSYARVSKSDDGLDYLFSLHAFNPNN